MLAGHLVTNRPLTEAKGSLLPPLLCRTFQGQVTLWSVVGKWGHSAAAWPRGRGSGTEEMLSLPREKGQVEDASRGASLSSWLGNWGLEGKEGEGGGLGMGTLSPSSALEVGSLESGYSLLLGHCRALSHPGMFGAWLETIPWFQGP